MKRDMELVKQLLKHCEENAPGERGFLFTPEIPGFQVKQVEYHIKLCHQAGYIEVNRQGMMVELTWSGHEKLDSLRCDRGEQLN